MTWTEWFLFFLILQVVHFAGTWKMYEAAGRKRWEALVPVYNAIVLMKIINRPTWWTILLFIPVVNLIMIPVVWVETLRSFGRTSTTDTLLVIFTLGFYLFYINYTQPLNHVTDRSLTPRSKTGDTISSLLFAIVVATVVHTYVMQPFTIPTSSLEKTLLVGDFLFVSKYHYGARAPMTTVAAPMVHDTIPLAGIRSYTKWPQLPYFRLPGFEEVKKNDIVVFNWPVDTVEQFFKAPTKKIRKPIDKKSNYVKRCVGTPGDSLSIRDGVVFIDGKELKLSDRARPQYSYSVLLDPQQAPNLEYVARELDLRDGMGYYPNAGDTLTIRALTEEGAARLRAMPGVLLVKRNITKGAERCFPGGTDWNGDNFGPIYIPEKGKTVKLDKESLKFYKQIIREYEGHDLQVVGDEIRIDGKVVNEYTFAQNYYWMMGDNRHNSEDSRYWGYVPETHIVGKPVFIWMSIDGSKPGLSKFRWERFFTTVGGDGKPVSYLWTFPILLAIYFGADWYYKRKRREKEANNQY
jgi:signal peptidase I